MSLSTRLSKTACLAAIGVALPLTATAPAEAAVDKQLVYECKFPIIAPGTISLDIRAPDIPTMWPVGTQVAPWAVTTKATFGAPIQAALSHVEGLASLEGTAALNMGLVLTRSDGTFNVAANANLEIPKTPFAPTADGESSFDLLAAGRLPTQYQDDPASGLIVLRSFALNLTARDATGRALQLSPVTEGWDNTAWQDSDGNPDTFDVVCRLDPTTPGQTLLLGYFDVLAVEANQRPSTPLAVPRQPGDIRQTSQTIRWGAATDPDGAISGYRITVEDETHDVGPDARSFELTGLGPEVPYEARIWAIDDQGAKSSIPLVVLLDPGQQPDVPTAPGTPTVVATATTARVSWSPSTDADGIKEYRVFQDGVAVQSVTANEVTLIRLQPATDYAIRIVAIDNTGRASAPALVGVRTMSPELPRVRFGVSGVAQVRTLSKGTLPIKGALEVAALPSSGALEGDLLLDPTTGRLTALGFLPVTAKIGFVPSGKTVGSLRDGQWESTSKMRIKVQEVKLFGAIPLAGGNSCQTRSLSEIKLKSTQPAFDPAAPGPLSGTFAISDLNGCGVLNGLVSPLTAGTGNTLNLTLTPKP